MSFKPERNYRLRDDIAQNDPNPFECNHCHFAFNRNFAQFFLLHLAGLDGPHIVDGHDIVACDEVPLIILAKARLELQGLNIGGVALNINAPINFESVQHMNPAEHFCWNNSRISHPNQNLTFHLSSFVTSMGDDGDMGLPSKRGMDGQFQHMRSSNWKPILHMANLDGTLADLNPQVLNLMERAKVIQKQCLETSNQIERAMDSLSTNPTLTIPRYQQLRHRLIDFRMTTEATLFEATELCETVALIDIVDAQM